MHGECGSAHKILNVLLVQLLRKSESSLVLLDVSQELPQLQRVPGLSKWLVKSNGEMFGSWQDAEAKQAGPLLHQHSIQCLNLCAGKMREFSLAPGQCCGRIGPWTRC